MTRTDESNVWLLRHAERLIVVIWAVAFGVLGVLGCRTTLLIGPPGPGDPTHIAGLYAIVDVTLGIWLLVAGAVAARPMLRRPTSQ